MNRNVLVALGIMVVLGVISAVLTYLRAEKMSPVSDIATKGLAAVQRGNLTFFGVFIPVLVGVCSFLAYRTLLARSPATAQTSYLLLAIGIGVALSIAAAGARLGVPVTVHVAIGTDVVHMHPSASGAAIGEASLRDWAVIRPAVSCARWRMTGSSPGRSRIIFSSRSRRR